MATNNVLALEANFKSWQGNRFPAGGSKSGINIFEYYCIEQFTRSFDLGDSQLKTGMIGGGRPADTEWSWFGNPISGSAIKP